MVLNPCSHSHNLNCYNQQLDGRGMGDNSYIVAWMYLNKTSVVVDFCLMVEHVLDDFPRNSDFMQKKRIWKQLSWKLLCLSLKR